MEEASSASARVTVIALLGGEMMINVVVPFLLFLEGLVLYCHGRQNVDCPHCERKKGRETRPA